MEQELNFLKSIGYDSKKSINNEDFFDSELLDKYYNIEHKIKRREEDEYGNRMGFDDIDIREEQELSKRAFNSLSEEEKKILINAIINFSNQIDRNTAENKNSIEYNLLLSALKLTGREDDFSLADEIEKNSNSKLDNVRVAIGLFGLTYKMWSLNNWVKPVLKEVDYTIDDDDSNLEEDEDSMVPEIFGSEYKLLLKELNELKKIANTLSKYEVELTHSTSPGNLQKIVSDGYIIKSSSEFGHHYEGDGVYTGLLGSYRQWYREFENELDDTLLYFKTSISNTIPIVVNYLSPKAMCNILTSKVFLKEDIQNNKYNIAFEAFQWLDESKVDEFSSWKVDIFSELLKCKVISLKDDKGRDMLVVNTKEAPIVWGSIARTLRLRRVVPLSSVKYLGLSEDIIQEVYKNF